MKKTSQKTNPPSLVVLPGWAMGKKPSKSKEADPSLKCFLADGFCTFASTHTVPEGTKVQLKTGEVFEIGSDKGCYAVWTFRLKAADADRSFSVRDVYAATIPLKAWEDRKHLFTRAEQRYFGLCAAARMERPLPLHHPDGSVVKNLVELSNEDHADAVATRLKELEAKLPDYAEGNQKLFAYKANFDHLLAQERARLQALRSNTRTPPLEKRPAKVSAEKSGEPVAPKAPKAPKPVKEPKVKAPKVAKLPKVEAEAPASVKPAVQLPEPLEAGQYYPGMRLRYCQKLSVAEKAAAFDQFLGFMETLSTEAKKLHSAGRQLVLTVEPESNRDSLMVALSDLVDKESLTKALFVEETSLFRMEAVGLRVPGTELAYYLLGEKPNAPRTLSELAAVANESAKASA